MKSLRKSIAALLTSLVCVFSLHAQEVVVTVTTVQEILPPQLMLYVVNPSDYFNITLSNNTDVDQNVYLVMQLEQVVPASELSISVPPQRQPKLPIIVPASGARQLSPAEIRGLFNHVPLSEISAPLDLFDNYMNGSFGLLPEGDYRVSLTAYRWDLNRTEPLVVSAPAGGSAFFKICYQAQAPAFLTPLAGNGLDPNDLSVADLNPMSPQFTWQAPTTNCHSLSTRYNYDFRVVELLPGQMPDEVMDGQNVVYQITNLTVPMAMIPQTILSTMKKDAIYAAQVTARSANTDSRMYNYVSIVNGGKSVYRLFRIKKPGGEEPENPLIDNPFDDQGKEKGDVGEEEEEPEGNKKADDDKKDDDKKDDGKKDKDEESDEEDYEILFGQASHKDSVERSGMYEFQVPELISPAFSTTVSKFFVNDDMVVEWHDAYHLGGEGMRADTLQFEYEIQLFNNRERPDKEEALTTKPVFTRRITGQEREDSVHWEELEEFVEAGDYLVLRVQPICLNDSTVIFKGENNVVDFALANRLSKQYFQCSNMVEIDNTTPTTLKAEDLKGYKVSIGQYELTIDEITGGNAEEGFTGKGRVEWNPLTAKVMVCVKFEHLKINTDDEVYEGEADTYAEAELTSSQCVDKLFSDWGIDNLIGDTGLPYASQMQKKATGAIHDLAKEINFKQYYDCVVDGQHLYDLITTGEIDHLYFPVKMPKIATENSPVNIQIASMKFAPTYAYMNIIGEAMMPKTDYTNNDILIFGAPRVCISPDRFLPESGHVALLSDFTIKDPNSEFTITFNAPENVLEPKDGCYFSWHDDKFEDLGLDLDLVIPDLLKDDNGKATNERPKLHAGMRISSWNDFIIDNITMEPFQHADLPGYTFEAKDIVVDLSDYRNSASMSQFPDKYSKDKAGCKQSVELWHGLYVGNLKVAFPSSLQIGTEQEGRLKLQAENMFFDKSGVTLNFGADSVFAAKTGKLGGWGISLDHANLTIIQNDFENCHFDGMIDIPLFEAVSDKKKDEFGEIRYSCNIRRLTDPREGGIKADSTSVTPKKQRFSYVFRTEEIDDLSFNFIVADAVLDKKQTYFLLEAEDNDDPNSTEIDTRVELCLGGHITIGGTDKVNEELGKVNDKLSFITDKLPMPLKIPGIQFTKMRISNIAHDKWESTNKEVLKVRSTRMEAEKALKAIKVIAEAKERELVPGSCYLNLGEWSLASPEKKIGPFKFKLNDYGFNYDSSASKITVDLNGDIEFNELVCVGAGIGISSTLKMPEKKTDLAGYSLSDGDVEFKEIHLGIDVAGVFKFDGKLNISKEGENPGYAGTIDIDVAKLFALKCKGGYYEHKAPTEADVEEKKADAQRRAEEEKKANPKASVTWEDFYDSDPSFAWGYFLVSAESKTGIRLDPLVINRISGGFYFNCQPTAGEDKENNKFDGDPEPAYGNIGVAFGMTMSTSGGEQTLKADVDMLVAYDRKAHCLTTFMFNGKMEAVGGIVSAKMSMVYQNELQGTKTKNRYLCLNITAEGGADAKEMGEKVAGLNGKLEGMKETLDKFQGRLDKADLYEMVTNPEQGLKQLSGDYEANEGGEAQEGDDAEEATKAKEGEAAKGPDVTYGKFKVPIEFQITWTKNYETYNTPKWHLYVGEPAKDKRCTFTFLKFNSSICSVDIGADAYLCLGNELPDNGALPPIPSKITEFLSGHKSEGTDMGGDIEKVNRSRAAVIRSLLSSADAKGGVMVGASAWGNIDINLGLLYGKIESLAGFDASLVNYGNAAFCVNNRSAMGKNGWYAMGQLYAYLGGELGVHIKIGSLIDEHISLIQAGLGGLLEIGLPNPTWIEGQCRVKMSFLGGLAKINKKFEFAAGDRCVPFRGNALDGFELFQNVSLGSDSLYEALARPEFAISAADVNRMTFTTNTSLGSHYRLVDPSYQAQIASDTGEEADKLSLHASRTYVFDMNQDRDKRGMKMGVRLIDMGSRPNEIIKANPNLSPEEFYEELRKRADGKTSEKADNSLTNNLLKLAFQLVNLPKKHRDFASFAACYFNTKSNATAETSIKMRGRSLDSDEGGMLHGTNLVSYIDLILDLNGFNNTEEVDVSFREDRGTTFHLTNMNVKPGHSYALVLTGDAYEIENGRRVWCSYVDTTGQAKNYDIHWKQSKIWFFRVKDEQQNTVIGDSIRDLEPYVALAYPSVDGTKVTSGSEGYTTAYISDVMHPTIALNRDLSAELPEASLKWKLTAYHESDTARWHQTQERDAVYLRRGNCINLEPGSVFDRFSEFATSASQAASAGKTYNFSDELYHLQLVHTYEATVDGEPRDSLVNLVDLWLTGAPHDVTIAGKGSVDDSWLQTTSKDLTGELLPYVRPFVGARPWEEPTIEYESNERRLTDSGIVFDNSYQYKGKPYRLIDPYLYLAYLGKWTFIPDRAISAYAWDDAEIPFGSESLIFERNGTVVNAEFMKDENSKSLVEVRNEMYRTWNDWYYNNSANNPMYPLPITAQTVGGPTVVNQDGRASTITPLNLNHYTDQSYNLKNLVNDFTAPYVVANNMCQVLRHYARELFGEFVWSFDNPDASSDDQLFNSLVNKSVLTWNKLHRGQYITVNTGDVTVKVPFYQLPLIFGDCFGDNAKYNGRSLSNSNRSFRYTIGQNDITSKSRWPSRTSNLLFFRLTGPDKCWSYTPQAFNRYQAGEADNCYINPAGSANQMEVAWDEFDLETSLEAVTSFKARIYRVDSYDLGTAQYTVSNVGGGPWIHEVAIDANSAVAANMNEMYGQAREAERHLATHHDKPVPQVLWSEDGEALTFLYSDSIYNVGSKVNGRKIQKVWAGDEVSSAPWQSESMTRKENDAWRNLALNHLVTEVTFDPSFAKADIRTTGRWFNDFVVLTTINGLQYLNTSKITDFSRMFAQCVALTSIDLSSFTAPNATQMSYMFSGCKKLQSVRLPATGAKLEGIQGLFMNCTALTDVNIENLTASKAANTERLFYGCSQLRQVRMDKLSPEDVKDCDMMFRDVTKNVHVYYAYDLDERIKDQIPGTRHELENPVKAIHATNARGETILLFINSSKTYSTGATYNIQGAATTYPSMRIVNVWSKDKVLDTRATAPWSSYRTRFTKVIFDPSFKDSPASTAHWFDGFSNLTAIEGLENFNTKKVTDMSFMFNGCSKLQAIDAGKFQTGEVTNMCSMFAGCASLVDLTIAGFRTSKVTDVSSMFEGCKMLVAIDLGTTFYTSEVKDFTRMFKNCSAVQTIRFNWGFSTEKATSTSEMFAGCSKLTKFEQRNPFDMQTVKDMSSMFQGCSSMDNVLTNFVAGAQTRDVTNLSNMFKGCSSVRTLDLTNFYTAEAVNMAGMFDGCSSLTSLNLCNLSSESMKQCEGMFTRVPGSTTIYLSYDISKNIYPAQVKEQTHPNLVIIYPAQVLKVKRGQEVNLVFLSSRNAYLPGSTWNGWEVLEVTSGMNVIKSFRRVAGDIEWIPYWYEQFNNPVTKVIIDPSFAQVRPLSTATWFARMDKLTSIEGLQYLNTSDVENMSTMFAGCKSLKNIPGIERLNTAKVRDMSAMFSECESLVSLDLSNFNTSQVTTMAGMFRDCKSLTRLDLSSFDFQNLEKIGGMFRESDKLQRIIWPSSPITKVTSMAWTFYGCSSLASLDLSRLEISAAEEFSGTFRDCSKLRLLTLGEKFNVEKAYLGNEAFSGVHDLVVKAPGSKRELMHNAFVAKLGFVDGQTGWFDNGELDPAVVAAAEAAAGEADEEDGGVPQVFWSADAKKLIFYCGPQRRVREEFEPGCHITTLWKGDDVTSATFTTTGANAYSAPWTQTLKDAKTYITVVFDPSFSKARPKNTVGWFRNLMVDDIVGWENLNTSETTNMTAMFREIAAHNVDLDLWPLKTSKVTNMYQMFYGSRIKSLNLMGFTTDQVENMALMFSGARILSGKLDLSNFNTSRLRSATDIFKFDLVNGKPAVSQLLLDGGFVLRNLVSGIKGFTGMTAMEVQVPSRDAYSVVQSSLTDKLGFVEGTTGRIVVPGSELVQAIWTEGNTTLTFAMQSEYKVGEMFNGQKVTAVWNDKDVTASPTNGSPAWHGTVRSKLTKVVFDPSFKAAHPTSMRSWFSGCSKLTTISNLSNLNSSKVTNMSYLFNGCSALTSLNVSNLNTSEVTTFSSMFNGCSSLTSLDVSKLNSSKVTDMSSMFYGCSKLTSLTLTNLNTAQVTTMANMFRGCSSLTSINVSGFDTRSVKSMLSMFQGCSKLKTINLSKFNTQNVVSTSSMFEGCSALTKLDISYVGAPNFKMSQVTNASYMFRSCGALTSIKMQSIGKANMMYMFENCTSLTDVGINAANPTSLAYTFRGCTALTSITLSWKADDNTSMSYMFSGCTKLESVNMRLFSTRSVKNWSYMFNGCSRLKTWTVGQYFSADACTDSRYMFSGASALKVVVSLTNSQLYLRPDIERGVRNKLSFKGTLQ